MLIPVMMMSFSFLRRSLIGTAVNLLCVVHWAWGLAQADSSSPSRGHPCSHPGFKSMHGVITGNYLVFVSDDQQVSHLTKIASALATNPLRNTSRAR